MYDIFANPQWTTPVMIVNKIHKIYRYKILTIQFLHCRMTFLSRLNCDFVLYNIMNYIALLKPRINTNRRTMLVVQNNIDQTVFRANLGVYDTAQTRPVHPPCDMGRSSKINSGVTMKMASHFQICSPMLTRTSRSSLDV